MKTLNKALRLIRIFHDKTLSELAKELGISIGYLSEIESGKKIPSLDVIKKYADVFNIKESSILFFAEQLGQKNKIKNNLRDTIIKFLEAIEELGTDDNKSIPNRKKPTL